MATSSRVFQLATSTWLMPRGKDAVDRHPFPDPAVVGEIFILIFDVAKGATALAISTSVEVDESVLVHGFGLLTGSVT